MTLSVWRYAHLTLALIASLFLVIVSVTGIILAFDAAQEKTKPYRVAGFEELNLAQSLPVLKKQYPEISELNIDYNGFVTLKGFDNDNNEVDACINPKTGEILGKPVEKTAFIEWVTSVHRSLFLKETGRAVIGVTAFLLLLIAISGIALVIQRQRGLRRFFTKVVKEYFSQYYHVISGRLALIPILLIALSGTYLSMARFKLFPDDIAEHKELKIAESTGIKTDIATFSLFRQTKLANVSKIEFPFSDDPEEFYTIKLKDRELLVDQFSGVTLSEVKYPYTLLLESLSLDLHTGRGNILLAVILGLASFNILFFIYSGFTITLKRRAVKIKNRIKPVDARYVLLVGSENGSTLTFANAVHEQLTALGKSSFIGGLNQYGLFPKATHLLVFTSTYGLGDPPSNADKVMELITKYPQKQALKFTVIGFGSQAYPDFCRFACQIDEKLTTLDWAEQLLPLYTVDDKSAAQFTEWVKAWNEKTGISLATTPALYAKKPQGLQKMMVLDKTTLSGDEHSFLLTIRTPARTKFTSGDLLAVYPANDNRERLYSIGRCKGNIQLLVKLHPQGLGSGYLHDLKVGDVFKGRLVSNAGFHRPKDKPVLMIANGTGIAPFLGMLMQSSSKTENYLYAGFRQETTIVKQHKHFFDEQLKKGRLKQYQIAFSREQNHCYVMDLISNDAVFIASFLEKGGMLMICGSLKMQQDVENTLDLLCREYNGQPLAFYKSAGQLLTDCY